MSAFNMADYEPVEDRLAKFWAEHPCGRVATDLVFHTETQYIVKSEVYADFGDPVPLASGYAEERVSAKGVNSTSALENCETSAIGRALANAGYAPKGARPSREEMGKAQRRSGPTEAQIASAREWIASLDAYDQDGLRALWVDHGDLLDIEVDGTMLRSAIIARKEMLDKVDAAAVAAEAAQ